MKQEILKIRFTSDYMGNKTSMKGTSQARVAQIVKDMYFKKKLIGCVINKQIYGHETITFTTIEDNERGYLVISIDESICGKNNIYVNDLKKIASNCAKVKYYNFDKLKEKAGKLLIKTTAVLATSTLIICATGKILEGLGEEWEATNDSINDMYTNEQGVDVRKQPDYNDNGYYRDPNHYIDKDGIQYVKDENGNWHEIGIEVDLEEKGKTY